PRLRSTPCRRAPTCSSQHPCLAQEPRVVKDQADRHRERRGGREHAADPAFPPVLAHAPDAEHHRESRGQQDQQRVEPPEIHYFPGGFAPPDPPTRSLAGTPTGPAPLAWLPRGRSVACVISESSSRCCG